MSLSEAEKRELAGIAAGIRRDVIQMALNAGSGHPGGCLSAVEILTVLFHKILKIDPKNSGWEDRDRFVLSKGHAAAALYGALIERGFFPREEMELFRNIGGRLQGHPNMLKVPGVDMSSGSLGQGLSVAVGMALGARLQRKDFRVYALIGCAESQEGSDLGSSHGRGPAEAGQFDCFSGQQRGSARRQHPGHPRCRAPGG